jgi:NAD(P)-dependent dehydrogenase (short-subunit alcohol dehydrogenase family)
MGSTLTILVTGASRGFGRLTAERLARRGHRVYAGVRDRAGENAKEAQGLLDAAERDRIELAPIDLDVTSDASVDAAVARVLERSGSLDVVVNNAGRMYVGVSETFTAEEFRAQLDVNLLGPFRVMRAALPSMRARGDGLVVNVTSTVGRIANPFYGIYTASKWGLEGLSQSMRYDLAPCGVDVVVVEPGPFPTDVFPGGPRPADRSRERGYAGLDGDMEMMERRFQEIFARSDAPSDPTLVADAIVGLVETPAGERPFRTVVGVDFGVRELNAATAPVEEAALEAMGVPHRSGVGAGRATKR